MEKKTTLQVFEKTKDKLRKLGERNEDYDSIINRAILGEFIEKPREKEANA